MLYTEKNHNSKPNLKSLHTMDYSIINHDSDTLLSVDLELNLSECDMFGIESIQYLEENQNDDKVDPWPELQNNSLDMSTGFDLSYSVMVNPRSVMADMSNHGSISKNKIIDSHSFINTNDMGHLSDRTETPESTNWSFHHEQNISENESDDYYGATESEEESDKQINDKEDEATHEQSLQPFDADHLNSTVLVTEDITQPLHSQSTETKTHFSKPHVNINKVELQRIKIVQNSNQAQKLRRQICNSSMQARLLVQQHSQQTLQPIKVDVSNCIEKNQKNQNSSYESKYYPKPTYSYSCLIAMALKNSQTGLLPVSEIYKFMCDHFPYFKTAPSGWKNSVRHNLSLNKCFEKVEKPDTSGNQRKGCLWAINSSRKQKMDEEMKKWSTKDRSLILSSLLNPEFLKPLENGELKHLYQNSSEQIPSILETESASTDELGSSTDSGLQNSYLQSSNEITTANSVTDSENESSRDTELDLPSKMYIDNNVDGKLLQFNVSSQKNISVFDMNQLKKSPKSEKNHPSSSPVYEYSQSNDSPVYQFSLPNDSPVHQMDQKSKINSIYQFKQGNSNSNSCNSWSSSNSNSDCFNPDQKDNQASSSSEFLSNQKSKKRQKSFVGIIHRTGYNAQSVIEVRRKLPVSRMRDVSSSLQY